MIGNIGSGKSTLSKKLHSQGFLIVNADSIRNMLGGGEYVFDFSLEKTVIHDVSNFVITKLLRMNRNIVVDETFMKRNHRTSLITGAKEYGYTVIGMVMPNFGKDIQVARRMASEPRGYTREKWGEVWDKMESAYEEPTKDEGFDLIINLRVQ